MRLYQTLERYWTREQSYDALLFESDEEKQQNSNRPKNSNTDTSSIILILWTIILVLFSGAQIWLHNSSPTYLEHYSPLGLDKAVVYEERVFNEGLWGQRTEYMGFTSEADAAWDKLLQVGIFRVPNNEAVKIGFETADDKELEGYKVYAIGMWHELHCLKLLRKAISFTQPPKLNDPEALLQQDPFIHVDHCIDSLRQTIMCQGSTALSSYRINKNGVHTPYFADPHICRQYEPLEAWANEHRPGNWTPERDLSVEEMEAWNWRDGVFVG